MAEAIVSRDPRTGQPVGQVEVTPPAEIPAAVGRARIAFERWSSLPPAERRPYLRALKTAVLDHGEQIARIVSSETGKSIADSYAYDVVTSLTVMDHYARHAERYLRPRRGRSWPFITTAGWTEYQPRGVAGVISPWNYPFFLPMTQVFTALAAGCAVVLKPSEVTPLTGTWFERLAIEAGLPSDLIQVIQGTGDVGDALVRGGVDVIAFTGSTRVGRKVAIAAAETLTPTILELGGKDAMVVLEDADLAQAARGAVWGATFSAGQSCVSVERCYVVDSVYDEFLAHVQKSMDTLAVGTGAPDDVGPVTFPPQIEIIEAQVKDAVTKGARILRGGRRVETDDGGLFFEPTLLVDVGHDMDLLREETFGPVLPIIRVADEEAALAAANDTHFGLHGSVWTRDRSRGAKLASRLQTGTVAVNDIAVNFVSPNLVFGGIGESGAGSGNFGPEGVMAFCHPKSITTTRLPWSTTRLLGAWYPRRVGMRYWKTLARTLYRW